MKLYNFGWGPYPRRLGLDLAEKGLVDMTHIAVEFPHRPDLWPEGFLQKLSPAHSLPVLELDDGTRIGQSIAILEYLEEVASGRDMLGPTPQARALTRECVVIFDEAAAFFGLWARQGSVLNADRHTPSAGAARAGAERYVAKLRVAEAKFTGPFLAGMHLTIADCVAFALVEFTDQFYGVPLPDDCPNLKIWYAMLLERPAMRPADYPADMLAKAYGLPAQTQVYI